MNRTEQECNSILLPIHNSLEGLPHTTQHCTAAMSNNITDRVHQESKGRAAVVERTDATPPSCHGSRTWETKMIAALV